MFLQYVLKKSHKTYFLPLGCPLLTAFKDFGSYRVQRPHMDLVGGCVEE